MAHLEQRDALCPSQGHGYTESTGRRHQTSDYCTLPLNIGHLWACMTSLSCCNAKGLGAVLAFRLLLKDTSACRLQRWEIKLSTFITLEQLLQPLSSPSFSHNNFIKMPNRKTMHVIIFFTIGQFFICCSDSSLVAMFRTSHLIKKKKTQMYYCDQSHWTQVNQ